MELQTETKKGRGCSSAAPVRLLLPSVYDFYDNRENKVRQWWDKPAFRCPPSE